MRSKLVGNEVCWVYPQGPPDWDNTHAITHTNIITYHRLFSRSKAERRGRKVHEKDLNKYKWNLTRRVKKSRVSLNLDKRYVTRQLGFQHNALSVDISAHVCTSSVSVGLLHCDCLLGKYLTTSKHCNIIQVWHATGWGTAWHYTQTQTHTDPQTITTGTRSLTKRCISPVRPSMVHTGYRGRNHRNHSGGRESSLRKAFRQRASSSRLTRGQSNLESKQQKRQVLISLAV